MPAAIRGLGSITPVGKIKREDSAEFAVRTSNFSSDLARRVRVMYRKTAIRQRGSVLVSTGQAATAGYQDFYPIAERQDDAGPSTEERLKRYEIEAPKLAVAAAEDAIRNSGLSKNSITHLITVSCTGFYSPGLDVELIGSLGLDPTTERVQIGFMGCHASINALRTASALVNEEESRVVLICCVELCTLHYQYGEETDHIVSNAIFADGASAAVITSDKSDHHPEVGLDPTQDEKLLAVVKTGSTLIEDSTKAMSWRIGDHGFKMTLSAEVPDLIEKELRPNLRDWLSRSNLRIGDIRGWAVHPGGSRILDAVEKSLELKSGDLEPSRSILQEHGNMSSATLLFILQRLLREKTPKPWVMLGFGPGLEIEMAILE